MSRSKDDEVYPVGTIVRFKKTGLFAEIREQTFRFEGKGFMHYLGRVEGKPDKENYVIYHEDVELEALPLT